MRITKMKIPFYENLKDDTHCFQAVMKMVLKYFESDKNYSWKKLEEITAKKLGLWTWSNATAMWLANNNYEVVSVDDFDTAAFIKNPPKYLLKKYGKEAGQAQIEHSDLIQEQKIAKKLINFSKKILICKIPTINNMKSYLERGFLLMVNVNANTLDNEKGYCGHSILVYKITKKSVIFHDPGSPGRPARRKSLKNFINAWAYPNKDNTNFIAVKKTKRLSNH